MWRVCMMRVCSSSSLRILADVASSTLSCATRAKEALSTKISFFISDQDSSKVASGSMRTVHPVVTCCSHLVVTLNSRFTFSRGKSVMQSVFKGSVFAIVLGVLLSAIALEAQQNGTITGAITDQVGKPIPEASVE